MAIGNIVDKIQKVIKLNNYIIASMVVIKMKYIKITLIAVYLETF